MISVIIPCLIDTEKKSEWLDECLNSVQIQNINHECLIFDDNSPVDITHLIEKYPQYRWYRSKSNVGPSIARNTLVSLSEFECIVPLDADDLLASEGVLNSLYTYWDLDRTKIVYGNLKRLLPEGDGFTESKEFTLGEYSYEKMLNMKGVMPVTSMFSKECWEKSGGWKPEFEHGFEDVEFYLSAGRACFCGTNINQLTLLYRKHNDSRYARLKKQKQEGNMRRAIQEYHSDLFGGNIMACCGNKAVSVKPQHPPQGQSRSLPSSVGLENYAPSEITYVKYVGSRTAAWGVNGPFTGISYKVPYVGAVFPVHINDRSRFAQAGRGRDFQINVDPPGEVVITQVPLSNEDKFSPNFPTILSEKEFENA